MLNDDRNERRDSAEAEIVDLAVLEAEIPSVDLQGPPNRVAWANEIRSRVGSEFERMRVSIESGSNKFRAIDRAETISLLSMLDAHRAEVFSATLAEYFIAEWQNPSDRLHRLINGDEHWKAINNARLARKVRIETVAPVRYLGFDDAAGVRIYKFGRLPSRDGMEIFVVNIPVSMFLKHKISFQDGPAMCSAIMAASVEPKDHWVTDEDSLEFIARRPVKSERKPPRQKQALPAQ
jgi:hypothetical protein